MSRSRTIFDQMDSDDLQMLSVILDYPGPEFSGKWIRQRCIELGVPFHQSKLTKFANFGILKKEDAAQAGNKRYYCIRNRELAEQVIALAA